MSTTYFHFKLGPIQSFIAQARRTRDFWAGSFILSWLSAIAMRAVLSQDSDNNEIVFPRPDPNVLKALENDPNQGLRYQGPVQARTPTRFKARVTPSFDPQAVESAVRHAWQMLAKEVWNRDLDGKADALTKTIWQRQIDHCWQITWIMTDKDHEAPQSLLDRRGRWYSHYPPEEGGVKCSIMSGCQELSGIPTPDANALENFWVPLREAFPSDLQERETLSALALIKRRFPRHFQSISSGWKIPTSTPSVAYLAATPWLERVLDTQPDEELNRFYRQARHLLGRHDAWSVLPNRIENRISRKKIGKKRSGIRKKFAALNGEIFFRNTLFNSAEYEQADSDASIRKKLDKMLITFAKKAEFSPSPFYALLLMDGDGLGDQVGDPGRQQIISAALDAFTQVVPGVVEEDHNGFLVYAGGDDVMALLPLEHALPCAANLRQRYQQAFDAQKAQHAETAEFLTTISAAVQFAHYRIPLTRIIREAHKPLLDDIAKDDTGRDALAVRVNRPGGTAIEWAIPWTCALDDEGHLKLEQLVEWLKNEDADASFSSRFIYQLGDLFQRLSPQAAQQTAGYEGILADSVEEDQTRLAQLITGEYVSSRAEPSNSEIPVNAEPLLALLADQSLPWRRKVSKDAAGHATVTLSVDRENPLSIHAALLARFLVKRGIGDD